MECVESYHEQSPEGVVEKDKRGCHKHGDAYEFVKLLERAEGVQSS